MTVEHFKNKYPELNSIYDQLHKVNVGELDKIIQDTRKMYLEAANEVRASQGLPLFKEDIFKEL